MPYYNDLRHDNDEQRRGYELVFPDMTLVERRRNLRNLLALRAGLNVRVRPRRSDQNLLMASWNVQQFGHTTQRLPEAFFYMAEIIARFDLVSGGQFRGHNLRGQLEVRAGNEEERPRLRAWAFLLIRSAVRRNAPRAR